MTRKPSPAYFKSRMSTLLNPLFLGTIATIALIAVVIWQFLGENQVANNRNLNNIPNNANNSQVPPGFENPESAENANPATAQGEVTEGGEEETIDPGFLSQTTSGEEILEPISPTASRERQQNRAVRLYDQLVGLNLFPDLLPNQGNGNDPLSTTSPTGSPTPPQFSPYQNQYSQFQYRRVPSSQVGGAPSPLGQAVNTVMSNSNYYRYVGQRQMQQGQVQQGQVQGGVYGVNSGSVNTNLNFPNITPTLYGAPQQSFMPTYGAPSYGVPAGAGGYGGVSPYGAGVRPYGVGGVGVNPYGASSFSYGGGF